MPRTSQEEKDTHISKLELKNGFPRNAIPQIPQISFAKSN